MEADLLEQASEHGLYPIACFSCAGEGRDSSGRRCPNCVGSGRLWQSSGGLTLADPGLRRFLRVWGGEGLASHVSPP